MPQLIQESNEVFLYLDRKRTYLVRVERGKTFHTHRGFIQLDELIGKEYGTKITSSMGVVFVAFEPTIRDYILKMRRKTQITYPKDIAFILMYSGIGPGSHIVEAGTGTGALTNALAFYVRPTGRIYSYELRKPFIDIALKNLKRVGLSEFVEIKNKDITQGIDERGVDAVILDLATPWLVIPHVLLALKGSGSIVSFSPTIDQIVKTVEALKEKGFADIETIECFVRKMQVERGKTRPETLLIGHTGYITFARKVLNI